MTPLLLIEWLNLIVLMVLMGTVGRISPLWICGAVGIAFTLRALAGMFVVQKRAGVSVASMLARLAPPLLACVPMVVVAYGSRIIMLRAGVHSAVLHLAVQVSAGAVVFAGSALLLAPGASRDILNLVRQRRKARTPPVAPGNITPSI